MERCKESWILDYVTKETGFSDQVQMSVSRANKKRLLLEAIS